MEKTSMLYWYPKLQELNLNLPKTYFIELESFKDQNSEISMKINFKLFESLKEKIGLLGGAPVFIRTDLASNKHFISKSSYLPNTQENTMRMHLYELFLHNEMANFFGLPYSHLVVREWINLDYKFIAFKGLKIAKEVRVFINNGKLVCSHFYWPEDAIKFFHGCNERPGWQDLLKQTKDETMGYIKEIESLAQVVATQFKGYWSVDFAIDITGKIWLIDMAKGEKSWHPKCKKELITK
jgi:hypothetical protein